jgi:hypothetical protein
VCQNKNNPGEGDDNNEDKSALGEFSASGGFKSESVKRLA